jgi:AcrR family transcriptional regulator
MGVMRLTRAQQQQRTHERLLDAGRSVFLERGVLATTVEEVAAQAGYTRGAVYKHFGGKEGIWQAIIEARADQLLQGIAAALDRVGSREELLVVLNPGNVPDEDEAARWAVASAESLSVMAAHPRHAAAVAAIQKRFDTEVTGLLERHCERLVLRPAVPLPQLVVAWGAMGAGLVLRHAVDPGTDVAAIMASVLAAVFPPARSTASSG